MSVKRALFRSDFLALLVAAICIISPTQSPSEEPSKVPILSLEIGAHTAPFLGMAISHDRFLVTGSMDKTARVWELPEGRLLEVLRPPIGEGQLGRINAVAISPDSGTIVVAGNMGYDGENNQSFCIFQRGTGKMIRRITGLPEPVLHLAYSKDGRFLVATLLKDGIRIYRTTDYSLVGEERHYEFPCHGADFAPDGRLVTASSNGILRLYDKNFKIEAREHLPVGQWPWSVSFSPDGTKIAVGTFDVGGQYRTGDYPQGRVSGFFPSLAQGPPSFNPHVHVLSGKDLSYLYHPDCSGITKADVRAASWSSDGNYLYAGGSYSKGSVVQVRKWADGGKGRYMDLPTSRRRITQILPREKGGIVFAATTAFGVLDATGRVTLVKGIGVNDLTLDPGKFLAATDGATVQFGFHTAGVVDAARFSVRERSLELKPSLDSSLTPPVTRLEGLFLPELGVPFPKLNGKPLPSYLGEEPVSLAIAPNKQNILIGTRSLTPRIRLFDRSGNEKWFTPAPATALNVNISGNGEIAVAAFADGTIRWYRMKDGKELLAFFPATDRKRWILWTPSGYHEASPGGEDLIGWHVNNGRDQAADFFPASRFRSTHYRPDVIQGVLTTLDVDEAVKLANQETGVKKQQLAVEKILPPIVTIVSPSQDASVRDKDINVKYQIRSPSELPVTGIKVLVDGRPVKTEDGLNLVGKENLRETRALIPEKDCEIAVIAENRYSASEPAVVRVKWAGKTQEEFVVKPRLYALAIGVGTYKDKGLTLRYPAKDAGDFANALRRQKGGLYSEVIIRELKDDNATKETILDGLQWIERETTANDVAMLFLSGHGVNDPNGFYYFLPVDADTQRLKAKGVSYQDIKNTVSVLAGKVVVFLDTCHSGNIMGTRKGPTDVAGVVNELMSAENGAVVFASSMGRQYSLEDPAWGNGAFTKALVEGINGAADYTHKGRITVNMLNLYLSERVKELTKGQQTPSTAKPDTVPDFPIAVVVR